MKHGFLSCLFSLSVYCSVAQSIAINATGVPADPSAFLDISSTSKGVLIPRMSAAERAAIVSPAQGLLVFDTDSRTFWFYSNSWNELTNAAVAGPAGGDLSGSYPNPDVIKLQNHAVSPVVPTDARVLKWNGTNGQWQPHRDSLALPYSGTDAHSSSLFSVTNTWNGFGFNSAIHAQRVNPSGIPLSFSTAIWGDASEAVGILGTSKLHSGARGISVENHGVHGHTQTGQKAGVYGTSSGSSGAIGVLGEVTTQGMAIYGKALHDQAIAGRFESPSATNIFPTLIATNFGLGPSATFATGNVNNNNSTVYVNTLNNGSGIYAYHDSVGTDNAAVKAIHIGLGQGIYARSHRGDAGKLVIDNFFSNGNALHSSTIGDGSAGVFVKTHVFGEMTGEPAVAIENYSRAAALSVKFTNPNATTPGIDVDYDGYGYGIDINSVKGGLRAVVPDEGSFAVFGMNTAENSTAIHAAANAFGSTAIHGTANGFFGVGILGTSSHEWGTGVRGEAASTHLGAVTGVNSGGGPGVMASNDAAFGYGIIAESGSQHGIAGKFVSQNALSEISPAIWAHVQSLSRGIEIFVVNDENDKEALYINHHGVGDFARFSNNDFGEIVLAKTGNITTSGTLTVKDNKGIIRNSNAAQLRYETKTSGTLTSVGAGVGVVGTLNITFSSAFSAVPVVTIANVENIAGSVGQKLIANVSDVTSSGCTITIVNAYMASTGPFSAKWTVMAMGNE